MSRRRALVAACLLLTSLASPLTFGSAEAAPTAPAGPAPRPPGPSPAVRGLTVSRVSPSSLTLSWTLTREGQRDSAIEVRRLDGPTPPASADDGLQVALLTNHETSYTDTARAPGSVYSYAVFGLRQPDEPTPLATVTGQTTTGDPNTGFRGLVTDVDGAPIAGVTVYYESDGAQFPEIRTDAKGQYLVTGLVPGRYAACFFPRSVPSGTSPTGYVTRCYRYDGELDGQLPGRFTVTQGQITKGISANLPAGGAITGTVTDARGVPLRGVTVYATSGRDVRPVEQTIGPVHATTDSAGHYRMSGLGQGHWYVCFEPDNVIGGQAGGYLRECYNNEPSGQPEDTIPVHYGSVTPGINASLADGAGVRGIVTDTTGAPAVGVQVELYDQSGAYVNQATTNARGAYAIAGATPDTYEVCFNGTYNASPGAPNGYLPKCFQNSSYDDPAAATPVALPARTAKTVNGVVRFAGGIAGVIHGPDGEPVADAFITLYGDFPYWVPAFASSDDNGAFQLIGEPTGKYTICIDASVTAAGNYQSQCYDGRSYDDPSHGTKIAVTLGRTTPVTVSLTAGAPVTGTVTTRSGAPVPYASVTIYDQDHNSVGGTHAGEDGTYEVRGLTPGTYAACFDGYSQTAQYGFIKECWDQQPPSSPTYFTAPASGIDGVLAPAGAMSGTVTDPNGAGISDVEVEITGADGTRENTSTDLDGYYQVSGLAPGAYTVCFSTFFAGGPAPGGYLPACADSPVQVQPRRMTSGVDQVLQPAGEIAGTVTDTSGNPLYGVTAQVYDTDGNVVGGGNTDESGQYAVPALPAGTYTVCFYPDVVFDPGVEGQCYLDEPLDPSQGDPVAVGVGDVVDVSVQLQGNSGPPKSDSGGR